MVCTTNSRLVALNAYAGFQARPHAWWPAFQSSIDFRSTFRTPFSGPPPRSALSTQRASALARFAVQLNMKSQQDWLALPSSSSKLLHRNCQGMYVAKHGQQRFLKIPEDSVLTTKLKKMPAESVLPVLNDNGYSLSFVCFFS